MDLRATKNTLGSRFTCCLIACGKSRKLRRSKVRDDSEACLHWLKNIRVPHQMARLHPYCSSYLGLRFACTATGHSVEPFRTLCTHRKRRPGLVSHHVTGGGVPLRRVPRGTLRLFGLYEVESKYHGHQRAIHIVDERQPNVCLTKRLRVDHRTRVNSSNGWIDVPRLPITFLLPVSLLQLGWTTTDMTCSYLVRPNDKDAFDAAHAFITTVLEIATEDARSDSTCYAAMIAELAPSYAQLMLRVSPSPSIASADCSIVS